MLSTTHSNGYTITADDYNSLTTFINTVTGVCYGSASAAGWWNKPVENGTRLMLMISELAEAVEDGPQYNIAIMEIVKCISKAMEGDRKDKMDDKLPHRKAVEVELADALIRICDFAGGMNLDLGGAVAEKLHYNQERADHKLENRAKAGGKKY